MINPPSMTSNAKQIALWIVGAIVFLGLIIGISIATSPKTAGNSGSTANDTTPVAGEWTKGKLDAKVQLLEYGDIQCPACKGYEPMLKQIQADFGDKIGFTFRHFPLKEIHKNAEHAAWATEAAGAQGKFWEMHDKLYQVQTEWSDDADPFAKFAGYAQELGLDANKFKDDYNSSMIHNKVDSQESMGMRAGVDATPTFFLNGKKLDAPRSYDDFKNVIQKALDS